MVVQPYLCFEGRTEEAVEFYKAALGAEVELMMRYSDAPGADMAPAGGADKVMHVTMTIGDSTVMASDGRCTGEASFAGVHLSLGVEDVAEGERLFAALGEGGTVEMPFAKTFWSPGFGMLRDRFGVGWMVNVHEE